MSQLLDALKLHDPTIAQMYLEATGDKPGVKINQGVAEKMLKHVLKDNSIKENEASALWHLLVRQAFKKEAHDFLTKEVYGRLASIQTDLPTQYALTRVAHALSSAVTGRISFVSPKTNISYTPTHYAAVAKLIDSGEIVVKMKQGGSESLIKYLTAEDGRYQGDDDSISLPAAWLSQPYFSVLVVHEATHAIQDWLDEPDHDHWYVETDAFVAGAVAEHTIGGIGIEVAKPYTVARDKIGDLLKKRKSLIGKPFLDAYMAIYQVVKVQPAYSHKKDLKYTPQDKQHPESEKVRFLKKLQEAAKEAAAPAKP